VIWGGGEDRKLTRRLVYGGATRAGKRDNDGVVRGRGQPIPCLGSTRATVWSSRRWRPGRTVDGECWHRRWIRRYSAKTQLERQSEMGAEASARATKAKGGLASSFGHNH
jgi:hypothetical protein